MGKKKKRLKQLTAGIVIGAITISTIIGTMFAANSIKPEEATTSVAVFEDLLNNRSFVIDTFTKDAMPDSNPYGKLDGVGNIDYLSKDFLDNYKNDSKFGSAVDLYYRMNHEGETFSEIPSALLDVFANEADWTKFCQGAKSKSYDSLLTSIYQNDYKSVSGKSVGNEENSMQTLRTYSEKLGVVKDADEFIKEYFGDLYSDVNEIDEYNYLRQKTKLFDDNLETYVTNVNKVLIDGALKSDNTKTAKDFSSLYEAKYYADYGREGAPSIWNERYVAMNVEKNTKYLKKVTSAVKNIVGTGISTVNNIIMMENLYRNQESMHDTLVRVRNNAKKNNDNTFIRASSTYLKMLESDDLGDNVILNSGLKAIYDYSTTELNKFIWDKTKEGIRDEAASIVATQTGMDTLASQMAVSSTVGRTNAILAVGEALTKYGTGFDDVCEKIYLMKYLQEIKEYAVEAFNTDKDNYQKYKNESNMKEMDNYASAAIDDLQFLKRIVLLQNQLGYKTADAQMGSIAGKIMSWIDGCDDANDLEARYTNLQNALVDTAINPISTNPFSIDEGCTLKVIHSTDSELQTYAVYTNKEGKKCTIAEFDKVLLAGIKINGGTLNISDQADRDIVMNSLFVTDKGGSLQITGNGGDIHVGRLDINGEFYKPEKCTKKLIVEGNCNVISSCSLENLDLDIEGDCNVDDYAVLAFGGSNVTVDGDMNCNSGHLHMVNESDTLRVNGSLMLGEGYGTNSEHEMTAGTVEVKGDFTSKYKRDNSPYGYYETANHKTVFSGDKTQKISFVESSEVNQFNGNLELKNPEINFATPIYSLTVNNDMNITKTDNLEIKTILNLEKGSLVTNGNVHAKTMNIESRKNNIKGNLQVEGNVSFGEGSLTIDGNTEITQGNLHMKNDSDNLLVKGNLILGEDYGTNSEYEMTEGTVEVKGDFTPKYKRDYRSYGYYETLNHKTIFSGDKTQKISFAEPSEVNQFNGNLELKNSDINFATPIYSLSLNQDTTLIHTDTLNVTDTLKLNGNNLLTTGKVNYGRLNENGGTLEENPKLGHNYYKQLQPADPKEYDAKYADEIWVCKSCGKIFTDAEGTKEYDPDPCKNGHTIVVDEGKKATCITEGLTEGEHCKVCKKIIVAQKKIPATGHKYYEWTTTKENTCTEEGITQRKCRICSFTESKKLDKKAHEWDTDFTVDKKATFQADGSKSKHCKNCDAVYGSIVIPRVNEMKLSAVTYSYTGGVKTPSVTVKDAKGKTLKNNVDYTIKYASGRKNVGTYSVIMTLKGNYSTSKTMKFIINPKGTSISKLSKAKKSFTVKWKKQNTQTTGYRLIYSMNSKFKTGNKYVMITSNKTTSKSIKKLKAKKKYYIRICTYKTVGGTKYYSGWSSVKSVTTK